MLPWSYFPGPKKVAEGGNLEASRGGNLEASTCGDPKGLLAHDGKEKVSGCSTLGRTRRIILNIHSNTCSCRCVSSKTGIKEA